MGRKSKSKKVIRELKEQTTEPKKKGGFFKFFSKKKKSEAAKKSEEKIIPKEVIPETPKKPKIAIKINKKKLFGGVLALIMLAILVSVGYLLFQKAFRAQPVAKLLPAESTITLLEINTNFEHNQLKKTFNLLSKHPEFSKEKIIEKIETFLAVNYETELKPWLGREVAMAVVSLNEQDAQKVYFVEAISKTNAEAFLKKYNLSEKKHGDQKTYQIDGPFHLTFINDYLVFTESEETLNYLIDFQKEKNEKLYNSPQYRKIDNNLPLNRTAFLYVDFKKINTNFYKQFSFLNENKIVSEIINPLLQLFDAEGVCLVAMDENFALQSFMSLNPSISENSEYLSVQEKYNADLTEYIPSDVLALWGGENLEYQLKRLTEIMAGGKDTSMALFDSVLQNYSRQYFGTDINLHLDILPLLNREFAVAIESINNKTIYKLLFELDEPEIEIKKLHQIANNFATVGAVFEPKIVEHTLPDGTVGREIVAIPEEITKSESTYKEFTIYELKMGKQAWGIYYTVMDNIAVVSTDLESIKLSIDVAKKVKPSLKDSNIYASSLEPIMKSSDEITYFNLERVIPLILEGKTQSTIFDTISTLSSGRNYFNDGVVTINYVHLK